MKRLLPTVISLILLAGCSAMSDAPATNPTPTQAPTTSPSAENTAPQQTAEDQAGQDETAVDEEAESQTDSEKDSQYGDDSRTNHGLLLKKVDQLAGLIAQDGDTTVDFKVTKIVVDPKCTSEFSEPPVNGHYVALRFEVQAYPELSEELSPWFDIVPFDFKVWDDQGVRVNDSIPHAECFPENKQVPTQILPGEKAKGWVVVDAATTRGSIGFTPGGMGTGWEWRYGG